MPTPAPAAPVTKKVLCPECDTETEITISKQAIKGDCGNCGIDVGAVLTRRRYEKALQRQREREEAEENPEPERRSPFGI